jgi:hypothetical protein
MSVYINPSNPEQFAFIIEVIRIIKRLPGVCGARTTESGYTAFLIGKASQ